MYAHYTKVYVAGFGIGIIIGLTHTARQYFYQVKFEDGRTSYFGQNNIQFLNNRNIYESSKLRNAVAV